MMFRNAKDVTNSSRAGVATNTVRIASNQLGPRMAHYQRSTVMKNLGFILGVVAGVLLAAAWLWAMTVMMFVM